MNHKYQASGLDNTKCVVCSRDFIAHTKAAKCEACDKMADCEIFGNPKNPKAMLLCPECTQKEIDCNTRVLEKTKTLMERAKELDSSIRYNGDFFNAQTIATADLKAEIWATEGLTEDQKQFKYQELIAERFNKFQNILLKLRNKEHEIESQMLSLKKSMIDLGSELRAEVRAKLREHDAAYGQGAPVVKPKVKVQAAKKSPQERLIESVMLARNCTKDEAEAILRGAGA